jgi:hypothetical protein
MAAVIWQSKARLFAGHNVEIQKLPPSRLDLQWSFSRCVEELPILVHIVVGNKRPLTIIDGEQCAARTLLRCTLCLRLLTVAVTWSTSSSAPMLKRSACCCKWWRLWRPQSRPASSSTGTCTGELLHSILAICGYWIQLYEASAFQADEACPR